MKRDTLMPILVLGCVYLGLATYIYIKHLQKIYIKQSAFKSINNIKQNQLDDLLMAVQVNIIQYNVNQIKKWGSLWPVRGNREQMLVSYGAWLIDMQ